MGDPAQPSNTTGEYPELPVIETTPAVELDQTRGPVGQVIPKLWVRLDQACQYASLQRQMGPVVIVILRYTQKIYKRSQINC